MNTLTVDVWVEEDTDYKRWSVRDATKVVVGSDLEELADTVIRWMPGGEQVHVDLNLRKRVS